MHDVREDFGVGIVAHVPGVAAAEQKLADRHERGILAVRHGGIALDEEGMAGVEIDGVVRVLPALGQDDLRFYIRCVEAEKLADLQGIAHFLEGQNVGIEGEDEERPVGLADVPERQAGLHQQVFLLPERLVPVATRDNHTLWRCNARAARCPERS